MKKKIFALILAIATIISIFSMASVSVYAGDYIYEYPDSNPIQTTYQPTYPLKDFPSGTSYFNDSHFNKKAGEKDEPCEHHGKCRYNVAKYCYCTNYATAIQCAAFARYAFDQYNHCSEWNPKDKKDDGVNFANKSDVINKFANMKYGTYVDLAKKTSYDHTFIFISRTSNGIMVYDANWYGDCGVQYHEITYQTINDNYSKINYTIAHNMSKTTNYGNSIYHKVSCSTSGCSGYILETHTPSTGATLKCTKCGYLLDKQPGISSLEDEINSTDYDFAS